MEIKFLTLNLYEGGLLFDNVLAFLEEEDPDIMALQEVYAGKSQNLARNYRSIEILTENLPDFHYCYAPMFNEILPSGEAEQGNAIFSRYPLEHIKTLFFDVPYDPHYVKAERNGDHTHDPQNMHYAQISIKKKIVNVFNVHGIWGLDGGDNPRRLKMSRMLVEQVKGKNNVILAGDFNLRPNTRTIRNIEQHLTNIFKDELPTTFNMKHKENPGYATSVVDMIFVSDDIRVIDHYCPKADISDHYPLLCVLEV